jgi:hypothetical protein
MPKIGQRLSRRHVVELDQGEKSEASCDEPSDGDVPMMDGDGETALAEWLALARKLYARRATGTSEILGCRCAVPELTRSADIQLNKRLPLRRHLEMLSQPEIVD